jgi:hypothetical protein
MTKMVKKQLFISLLLLVSINFFAQSNEKFIQNLGQVSDTNLKAYANLDGYLVGFYKNKFSYFFFEPLKNKKKSTTNREFQDFDKIKINNLSFTLPQGDWELGMAALVEDNTEPVYFFKEGKQLKAEKYDIVIYYDKNTKNFLKFNLKDGVVKYDIFINPEYNQKEFVIKTNGKVTKGEEDITINLKKFSISEKLPEVYYQTENEKEPADIEVKVSKNAIHYQMPPNRPGTMVIDPVAYSLKYGTYYGGNNIDYIFKVRTDSKKNSVVFGYTLSPNNIATAGSQQSTITSADYDLFVAKFDSLGNRLWATYLGGPGPERTRAGAIDEHDNIIIAGNTGSSSGIATAGAHQLTLNSVDDACLMMLSPNGQLKWGTYYGGDNHDFINDIDYYNGNLYLTGHTVSTNNIASAGAYQSTYLGPASMAFYSIFDTTGTFIYGTYVGGGNNDDGIALDISNSGDIFIVGHTKSTTNIATAGAYQNTLAGSTDIFVTKWTNSGSLVWGTYYGGINRDLANSVVIKNNHVFLTGFTESAANIATSGAFQTVLNSTDDGLLADFDANSGMLNKATYYGGNSTDYLSEVIFKDSLLYVFGYSSSSDLYITNDAFQNRFNGGFDNIFLAFDTLCNPVFSSYYGGSGNESGHSIAAIDGYHFAVAGYTDATNNLTTTDGLQTSYGGFYYDGFYSIICKPVKLTFLNLADSVALCSGTSLNLQSLNTFPQYIWNTGATTSSITVSNTGKYWLDTRDIHNCKGTSDTVYVYEIQVNRNISAANTVVCSGDSALLSISNGYNNYLWNTNDTNSFIYVKNSGNYFASFTDSAGCTHFTDTVLITVIPGNYNLSYTGNLNVCIGDTVVLFWADSNALQSIFWNNIKTTFSISPAASGSYYATAVDTNGCTVKSDTLTVQYINLPDPILNFNPGGNYYLCPDDTLNFQADPGYEYYNWSNGSSSSAISVTTPGAYYVTVTDSNGCSVTSDTARVYSSGITSVSVSTNGTSPKCYYDSVSLFADSNLVSYLWNTGHNTNALQVQNTGYYFYSGYDIYGCQFSSDTIFFEVYPEIKDSIKLNNLPPYCDVQNVGMQLFHPQYFNSINWNTGDTTVNINVSSSGYYYAQMIDTNGCVSYSDSVNIQFLQSIQPLVSYNPAKDTLCKDEKLFVTLNNVNSYNNLMWSNGDSLASTVYNASVLGVLIVNLNATDSNGCAVQFADTFVVTICNGIEELSNYGVEMYPNPAREKITIKSNSLISYLAIYNMEGKMVKDFANELFLNKTVDINYLPKGMYFVVIQINKEMYSVKFLKE